MILGPNGKPAMVDIWPTNGNSSQTYGPSLTNTVTGLGSSLDKGVTTGFTTQLLTEHQAEALYRGSWAAQKMVDIPVNDMFLQGREWTGDNAAAIDIFRDQCEQFGADDKLADAMKSARLYGGALIVLHIGGDNPLSPLDIETIRPGSLRNILVINRWDAAVDSYVIDIEEENFGRPYSYLVTFAVPEIGIEFPVHHSRVLRFDGVRPLSVNGWRHATIDPLWGVSMLEVAIDNIHRAAATYAGTSQLVTEASMLAFRVSGLNLSQHGRIESGATSARDVAERVTMDRSLYRSIFVDATDNVERLNYSFSGLPDIMDREFRLLASIAGIPLTRFMSQSPAGMNATGESDMVNYAIHVGALRKKMLDPVLKKLDMVLARNAGLSEPPDWEWPDMILETPDQRTMNVERLTNAVLGAVGAGLIDENEARERLSKIDFFGELAPLSNAMLQELRGPDPYEEEMMPDDDNAE